MNQFRGAECAHPGNVQPFRTEHEGENATAIPRRRYGRWGRIATVALVAVIAVWAIGQAASKRIEDEDIEIASRTQPAAPGFPPATETNKNNNILMRKGLAPDLNGIAVAYWAEADGLVLKADGRFQTNLSIEEVTAILLVDPASISRPGSLREIDPDAVLFRAQSGTLTPQAKIRSREMRKKQAWYVFPEWEVHDFAFTLNTLMHPNEEEKMILSAISRAARGIMPAPGDRIRAVGVNRGDFGHGAIITPGMLPPEPVTRS
jgi:hypothetical protein